jgi:hypothetical protein
LDIFFKRSFERTNFWSFGLKKQTRAPYERQRLNIELMDDAGRLSAAIGMQ